MGYVTLATSTVGYSVSFVADNEPDRATARISRAALLDGTVSVQHYGFSHGDRTKTITGKVTEAQAATLKTIFQDYTSHTLSADDGYFLGVIESLQISRAGDVSARFLIKGKSA